jgi:hypothetical protein
MPWVSSTDGLQAVTHRTFVVRARGVGRGGPRPAHAGDERALGRLPPRRARGVHGGGRLRSQHCADHHRLADLARLRRGVRGSPRGRSGHEHLPEAELVAGVLPRAALPAHSPPCAGRAIPAHQSRPVLGRPLFPVRLAGPGKSGGVARRRLRHHSAREQPAAVRVRHLRPLRRCSPCSRPGAAMSSRRAE